MLTLMRHAGWSIIIGEQVEPPFPHWKTQMEGTGKKGRNPHSPADVTGPPCSHTAGGGGEVVGTLPRGG